MTSHRHQDEEEEAASKTSFSWGTWEELLLASAVKRHGAKNWDSVSMELQTKTSLPHLLTTAQFCKQKYMDLRRRFKDDNEDNKDRDHSNNIPWLEHLRQVRVDELRQDLQRYDLSIHSLQLKVKKLEEEREGCLDLDNINTSTEPEADLNQHDASLNGKTKQLVKPERTLSRLVSGGEESDRENRSVNESNSTGRGGGGGGGGVELVKREAEPGGSGEGGDGEGEDGRRKESEEELGDSVTQLSSDVQSSASYGRKKRRLGCSGDGDAKSEPLIGVLDVIRTHKHASLFERRLKLLHQESSKYKEIVRQHVDAEIIQTRLEQGSYSSSSSSFYRDLLLLFNNAILFFPKSSVESTTAHQLRQLVSIEVNKEPSSTHTPHSSSLQPDSLPPQPEPEPKPNFERSDSLLQKHKTSAPIIVCRKRSLVSAKPSSSFAQKADQRQESDDKKPAASDSKPSLLKLKTQDKAIITGTRTSRRNNKKKNPTNTTSTPPSSSNKKQSTGTTASGSKAASASPSVDKQETSKTDSKKKTEASSTTTTSTSDKKKSVVNFLKRIKKNSPVQKSKTKKKKNNNDGGSEEPKRNNRNNKSGKKDKKGKQKQTSVEKKQSKDTSSPKKNVGRPPKKAAETAPANGKHARDVVVVVAKRQSKRARR